MITHESRHARPSRLGQVLVVASTLGLALGLAACGPQGPTGTGSTGTPRTPAATTAAATAATTAAPAASPSMSSPAETTGATPSSTAAATSTEAALCTAASLTGALDSSGGGAAGSVYMSLVLTNSSAGDCVLDGYPGVSMVKAGTIEPIGAPAVRDAQAPSNGPITLVPGASATAVLRYTQADNYQGCQREQADAVLVYPPSATDSLEITHPLTACSNADIKLLTIGAFQP